MAEGKEKAATVDAESTTIGGAEQHTVDERVLVKGIDKVDAAQDQTAYATLGVPRAGGSSGEYNPWGFDFSDGRWSFAEMGSAAAIVAVILIFMFSKARIEAKVKND